MITANDLNFRSLIFDSPGSNTINGIPAGYLSPNGNKLLGPDGQPQPLDIGRVIEVFHGKQGEVICPFSGEPADGAVILDNNPRNILITNLAPVNSVFWGSLAPLPRAYRRRTFPLHIESMDINIGEVEIEVFGYPAVVATSALSKVTVPSIPKDLGTQEVEAELLWLWKELTQKQLLKGLTKLTLNYSRIGESVCITNMSVLEFTMKMLQADIKEIEND